MQQFSPVRAYIFACSDRTEDECLNRMLFASNKVFENKVMQVKKGDILFLLNIDTDNLYGIFKAKTDGAKNIVPEAWRGKYSYQVAVSKKGNTKRLKLPNIFSKLDLNWHEPLEERKLEFILSLFDNRRNLDWGSLVADFNFKKRSNPVDGTNGKPPLEISTVWDYPTQNYGTKAKGDNTNDCRISSDGNLVLVATLSPDNSIYCFNLEYLISRELKTQSSLEKEQNKGFWKYKNHSRDLVSRVQFKEDTIEVFTGNSLTGLDRE